MIISWVSLFLFLKQLFVSFSPYLSPLFCRLELVSTLGIIRDVERMVGCRAAIVLAALDDEGVGLAPDHGHLGDEEAVDVPRDAPADMA